MTDDNDLVKRLRLKRERCHDLSGVYYTEDADCQAAADRIEELKSQLSWVIQERDDTFARMLQRAEDAEAKLAKAFAIMEREIKRVQQLRQDFQANPKKPLRVSLFDVQCEYEDILAEMKGDAP